MALGVIWALCLIVAAAASASAAGLTRISDHVYSYAGITNGSPQNSFGANAGIVVGDTSILVIDTLISAKQAQQLIADIRAISDKPIRYVVNTHSHLDHTFGNSEFSKLGAVIIAHMKCKDDMAARGAGTLQNVGTYGLTPEDMAGTEIALPELTFDRRMMVDLGGREVEIIFPGLSHSEGSVVVRLVEEKVMFVGDILFAGYHPFIADGDIDGWVQVLQVVDGMEADIIIPGHGPVSSRKDLAEMSAYLRLFDQKAKELAAGATDLEALTVAMKQVLPPRPEGEGLIKANLQMKYFQGKAKTN